MSVLHATQGPAEFLAIHDWLLPVMDGHLCQNLACKCKGILAIGGANHQMAACLA